MQHEQLIQELVEHLKGIHGLRALVLGGSYARGDQRPDSDIDLGLYYFPEQPLDVAQIRELARALNDAPDPIVAELGGLGTVGQWRLLADHRRSARRFPVPRPEPGQRNN